MYSARLGSTRNASLWFASADKYELPKPFPKRIRVTVEPIE